MRSSTSCSNRLNLLLRKWPAAVILTAGVFYYTICAGSNAVHATTVTDDHSEPSLSFGAVTFVGSGAGSEDNTVTVCIDLSKESSKDVTVPFHLDGTAREGVDYTLSPNPLTIRAGNLTGTITLKMVDDILNEDTETVIVTMGAPIYATLGDTTVWRVTIHDDDIEPSVSFNNANQNVLGEKGTANITAHLSAVSGKDVTVPYTVDGTSSDSEDYTVTPGPLVIPAGSLRGDVTVTLVDDAMKEDDETVEVAMGAPVNATPGETTTHTVTIHDDDTEPYASFALKSSESDESSGSFLLVISLSLPSSRVVTVDFEVADGTASDGADYILERGAVSFAPGETMKSVEIKVIDDALYEEDETITVTLSSPTNALLGDRVMYTHTIFDNDTEPSVAFIKASQSAPESGGVVTITAELSETSGMDVTVPYTVDGTSSDLEDYTVTPGPLVIPAGSLRGDVTVTLVDDAMKEDDETVEVAMGAPVNATPGETTTHTVTIHDDDTPPSISFGAVTFIGAGQGAEGNVVTVNVDMSRATSRDISIPLHLGGTARVGVDYTISPNPLIIGAGKQKGEVTITVIDDRLDEDEETIEVTMVSPMIGTLGERTVWRVIINDDDPEPVINFTAKSQSVSENEGDATISAELSEASGRDVTVPLIISGGAWEGADYNVTATTLTIRAGKLTGKATLTLVDDALDEYDETIEVTLGSPVNAKPGEIATHRLTITDNDPEPTVSFALESSRSSEDAGSSLLEVSLSSVSSKEVTVNLGVTGGTAAGSGEDYTLAGGTLAFAPGETVKSVAIEVIDDELHEEDETMELALSNPSNAKLGVLMLHRHTIADDDTKLKVAVLPLENLSGKSAPLKDIRKALIEILRRDGTNIVEDRTLEEFMVKYRVRYVGGIDIAVARALKNDTGANSVLITSLELYSDIDPPKIALSSRLVSTGDNPEILWINSAGLTGDTSPGLLDLGLIKDPQILLAKVLELLTGSLTGYLSEEDGETEKQEIKKRYEPKYYFRSPAFKPATQVKSPVSPGNDKDKKDKIGAGTQIKSSFHRTADQGIKNKGNDNRLKIAVVPFFNRSERKNAGEIISIHFIKHLFDLKEFTVVESGIVRRSMLETRTIMDYGLSFANADLIFDRIYDADLILTGYVWDYQEAAGTSGKPTVDFSAAILERKTREMVWFSWSHNTGDEGVFLFDWGKVNTAQELASEMARAVVYWVTSQ